MATEKREQGAPLAERLFGECYRFSFFRAVQLLEELIPGKRPVGEALSPDEEPVRFRVRPGFVFPASDLSELVPVEEKGRAEMAVAFMGLIGPSGVLPQWYNELAVQGNWERDFRLTEFLDLFHHRLISLFYLAWKKHRWTAQYLPEGRDRLSHLMLSLMGLGTPALSGRLGIPEETLIPFTGSFARSSPSAIQIESAVGYFAGAPAALDQFREREVEIDAEERTRLGVANSRLGADAVCGGTARESQSSFRLNLGPVGYRQFLRFTPAGDLLLPIASLVRYMAGMEYEFDLRVILKRGEVPLCRVGYAGAASPRLGWSTWLKTPGATHGSDPSVVFGGAES